MLRETGCDGVMLGRAAYHTPGLLGEVDARLFGGGEVVTPQGVVNCDVAVAGEVAQTEELTSGGDAPGMNRTCARGLGNRCSIH